MKLAKPILESKTFKKNYKLRIKENSALRTKFGERVLLLLTNKDSPLLRDHPLQGKLRGKRAFSVTGDIRVIYTQYKGAYYFLDIGTHNQVYK